MNKTQKQKSIYIIVATLFVVVALYIIEQVLAANYVVKSVSKLLLFLVSSIGYIQIFGHNFVKQSIKEFKFSGKPTKIHLLGLSLILLMLVVFFGLKNFMNLDAMMDDFINKYEVTPRTFIFYSLYIIIGNAFLEEFFFRGFVFLNLKEAGYRKLGYFLSSLLFSIYHISIFLSWFSVGVFVLALVGLMVGGLIFAYLDDKQETFLNSLFVHMCADIGLMIIGFLMLNGYV